MLKTIDWDKIKYFSPNENWGNINKISIELLDKLEKMREYAKVPFIIHCAYAINGHADKSYHYLGMAVDGHFKGMSVISQFLIADRFFNGIGMYGLDVWNNPGIHVDIRPYTARWCNTTMEGKKEYLPITEDYLMYLYINKLTKEAL